MTGEMVHNSDSGYLAAELTGVPTHLTGEETGRTTGDATVWAPGWAVPPWAETRRPEGVGGPDTSNRVVTPGQTCL